MKARPASIVLLPVLLAGSGCAQKTARLEIDAAAGAVDARVAARAQICKPKLWKKAETALNDARRLDSEGEVDRARAKADEARKLFREAGAQSPIGCEVHMVQSGGEDETGVTGGGSSDAVEAGTQGPSLDALEVALDTVYFDYNRSIIREDSKRVLTSVAAVLRDLPNTSLEIEGHCDVRGSTEYNLHLGERRARSVMKYLVTQGVDPGQLRIISYGEERPADFGFTEDAHAANRRAELRRP